MNSIDIRGRDLAGWRSALDSGEVTSRMLTQACLDQINHYDQRIRAFTNVFSDSAFADADAADARRSHGKSLGILDGIPIGIKDNIEIAGRVVTAGMLTRVKKLSEKNAFVIDRLGRAGAVVLGTLNMHEAALGATTENPVYGRTYNPHRQGFTPGGSSGGSAAAVAAGFCVIALGTDTLGSVRIPAAYCGVSGIKPTNGLVSLSGVVPLSWTLDTVGLIAASVRDLGLSLELIAGFDAGCAQSQLSPSNHRLDPGPQPEIGGLKLGRLVTVEKYEIEAGVLAKYDEALARLADSGAEIMDITLPKHDFSRIRRCGLIVVEAEGAVIHSQSLEDEPSQLSDSLLAFLEYGRKLSATKLVEAQREIARVVELTSAAFSKVNAVLLPTTPQVAFDFDDPVPRSQADFTALANLTNRPAVSVPIGFSDADMPVGMQVLGHSWFDHEVLQVGAAYQELVKHDMAVKNMR